MNQWSEKWQKAEEACYVVVQDRCLLCGNTKLYYEPPLYYCNGQCNGNRIRRNSYFYSGGRNQYHWCLQCYADIKEEVRLHGQCLCRQSGVVGSGG